MSTMTLKDLSRIENECNLARYAVQAGRMSDSNLRKLFLVDDVEALLALARKSLESSQAERPDGVVRREHREAAITVAQDQPGDCCRRWAEDGVTQEQLHRKQRLIAQLLATREAAAFAAGERAGIDQARRLISENVDTIQPFATVRSAELCAYLLGLLPAGKEQKL